MAHDPMGAAAVGRGFDPRRAVEIVAPAYGSGYRIGGCLVLTAAHLVPAEVGAACTVRAGPAVHHAGTVVWLASGWADRRQPHADAALIEVPSLGPCEPTRFARLPRASSATLDFDLYGWPRWAQTQSAGQARAGGRHIPGTIYLADTSPDGLLVVEPGRVGPHAVPPGGSDWEGISGAAIVTDGMIVGIQRHHQNPRRVGSLEAVLVGRFADDPAFVELLLRNRIPTRWPTVAAASDDLGPGEMFVAHPYNLLEGPLIGRERELAALHGWIGDSDSPASGAPVYCLLAIGGMGKSAVTWKWFHDASTAPNGAPWAGRMWWSFYETRSTLDQFVIRALAYVTGADERDVAQMRSGDRELALLRALSEQPFLIVLDGLERALSAYTDPAVFAAAEKSSSTPAHRGRHMADPNGDALLRRLAQTGRSRVLISSRLMPIALETRALTALTGVFVHELAGLDDVGARAMIEANGVRTGVDALAHTVGLIDNHPLVTLLLATEVARYRPAPGDFTIWSRDHPRFDLGQLDLVQRKSHILAVALDGLTHQESDTMSVIAAISHPAEFDWLRAILVERRTVVDAAELSTVLDGLDDRGIVGWDRTANTYDMHPIVRGAALQRLHRTARPTKKRSLLDRLRRPRAAEPDDEASLYGSLRAHFQAMPARPEIGSWADLVPVVELYYSTAHLGLIDEAFDVYYDGLNRPLRQLGLVHRMAELLQTLVSPPTAGVAQLMRRDKRAFALNEMALALMQLGRPAEAAEILREHTAVGPSDARAEFAVWLSNLSDASRECGDIAAAESAATAAMLTARAVDRADVEVLALQMLGRALSMSRRLWSLADERSDPAEVCFRRATELLTSDHPLEQGAALSFLVEHLQDQGAFAEADGLLRQAQDMIARSGAQAAILWAERLAQRQRLARGEVSAAYQGLRELIVRAREISQMREATRASLLLLDCLEREPSLGDPGQIVDELLGAASVGPLPFVEADVCLYRARQALQSGDQPAALAAGRRAMELAWPDPGSVFGYAAGRDAAAVLLTRLGHPAPALRPTSDSVPWSEGVELDPRPEAT